MGLSAASLHLLRPTPGADLTSAVTAAYKKLGYSKAKDDGSRPRGVALVDRGDFVSIHDSGNDTLDTGELRELAVILSKSTKSVAIVTTVNDSDAFEFLLFHRGKQIDAALSEPPSDEAGVTVREGKKRARAWFDAFQQRDFLQAVARGNSIGFGPETQIARYADAVEAAAGRRRRRRGSIRDMDSHDHGCARVVAERGVPRYLARASSAHYRARHVAG